MSIELILACKIYWWILKSDSVSELLDKSVSFLQVCNDLIYLIIKASK